MAAKPKLTVKSKTAIKPKAAVKPGKKISSKKETQINREETERLAREMVIMAEIGQIISSSLNIEEIYGRFAEKVREIIHFDGIAITSINIKDDTQTIQYNAGIQVPGSHQLGDTTTLAGTFCKEGIRTRSSRYFTYTEDKEEMLRQYPGLIHNIKAGVQSLLQIPLISKNEVIAMLHLRSFKLNSYTERDMKLAERIAHQIAGAIANAQLYKERTLAEKELKKSEEETRQLAQDNAIMAEIGRIISSTLDIDAVYELFASETRKLIPFDRLAVNLHCSHEENVTAAYVFGETMSGRKKGDLFPLKGSVSEVLINTRKGLYSYRAKGQKSDQRFDNYAATLAEGLRSVMGVPLIYRNEVIASLHFRSKTPNAYGERELRIAERIGEQIAGAIGSAKLFSDRKLAEEALKKSEEEARQLAQENAIIADIGILIGSTLDIDAVYERFGVEARKLIPFDRLAVNLHSSHEENVTVAYVFGETLSGRSKGDLFPLKGSISEVLINTRKGLYGYRAKGEENDQRFYNYAATVAEGLRSVLAVPLIYRDEVIASLHFRSKIPNAYGERELRMAERIGAQIAGAIGSAKLFSDRKLAEEALRESEDNFRRSLDDSPLGIRVATEESETLYANRAFLDIYGYDSLEELKETPLKNRYTPESYAEIKIRREKRARGETSPAEYEANIMRKNGEIRYLQVFRKEIIWNGVRQAQLIYLDITERKRMQEEIQHQATHDALTGLPNRLMFNQLLNHAVQAARRYKRQFAVLFLDLDRFKIINDTMGHEAGDQLLQEVSLRLKQALRAVDVVARLGGDEFVILIEEVGDSKQVEIVADKILSTVIKPVTIMNEECRVTASIGISLFPKDAEDEQSMLKNADIAMYLAKEEGKNNYQFYSPDILSKSMELVSLETNLRFALERNELSLHYQAKVDFKTNTITGVEALLRWQNPFLGSVTPTQFIPVAEETGLIVPIGRWVMRTACAQNVAWQRDGLPPVCIAVNLSLRQLMDQFLIEDIKKALNDSGMAPNLLELEITESMVMHNPTRMIAVLGRIKSLGVRLAIDDFGTGYSSLAQLKHFPVDTLKVDRSFIRNIPRDSEDRAITEAIIAMGKTLSLTVVAEGVETIEQMDFLQDHSCDEMQGYYFSKPIVPEQFADLLRQHVPSPRK